MTTVSDLNENTELVTLTSSQEQVLLNDIDNSANPSHLGHLAAFSTCTVVALKE
jgi:hypothetical protein